MSFTPNQIVQLALRFPIVPVVYHADPVYMQTLLRAAYAGGLRVFEFTNRGDAALDTFRELVPFVRQYCPDMALGIGTIFTPAEAASFIDAGADFIVQPILNPTVGALCQQHNRAWFPAGSTLNEIYQASQSGAELVKVFPASLVGPGFIKAIRGPLPHLKLMVTGGIEPTTACLSDWFGAGVSCVGIGAQLFAETPGSDEPLAGRLARLLAGVTDHQSYAPKP